MALPVLQLTEPVVDAMVALLKAELNSTITQLNADLAPGDPYPVDQVTQFLPVVPPPSLVVGGLPAVGVQEAGTLFMDDQQTALNAEHEYAIVAILSNIDHVALSYQLRRTISAIANTIQADRVLGTPAGNGGIMRTQGGVWSVNFTRTEPGPLLADLDPTSSDSAPRTYLSWAGLFFTSGRTEV